MAAHFGPVMNTNYRLVASPPTRWTAIGEHPRVTFYDKLREQLHSSNPGKREKEIEQQYIKKRLTTILAERTLQGVSKEKRLKILRKWKEQQSNARRRWLKS